MRLTAAALIECMKDTGYSISSGAYSSIEAGKSIPSDASGFIQAVSKCLELDDTAQRQLIHQLGYDIVKDKLGDFADRAFEP